MRPEHPPEQWLLKAWDGDVLIDLIFEPAGIRVTDQLIDRGEVLNVAGMQVRVMALDDVLTTKLLALDEHNADYSGLLRCRSAGRCASRSTGPRYRSGRRRALSRPPSSSSPRSWGSAKRNRFRDSMRWGTLGATWTPRRSPEPSGHGRRTDQAGRAPA
jgi:hypothetical protein